MNTTLTKIKNVIRKIPNQRYFFSLLALVGIFTMFDPPVDPDFGWHYKYGEFAVQNGNLLTDNTFTYTLPNYNWVNSYWLFEIILFIVHSTFGNIWATVLFAATLGATLLWYLHNESKNKVVMSFVFLLSTFLFSQLHIAIRPHLFSTIFMLFLMYTLKEKRYQSVLPLMFLIWANIHAEFVIGLFIYGVSILLEILEKSQQLKRYKIDFKKLLLFFTSIIVTLINPQGIFLWITMIKEMIQPINSLVGEWQSPFTKGPEELYVLLVYLVLIIVALFRAEKPSKEKLTLVLFTLFAFKSTYMLRIAFILAIPYIVSMIERFKNKRLINGLTLMLILIMVLKGSSLISVSTSTKKWAQAFGLPHEEVQILKGEKGNIFNYYGWGGYLIWQLPEKKMYIDGRMTGWKESNSEIYFTKEYKQIRDNPLNNAPLVTSTFEEYDIKHVLDQPNSPLVEYLLTRGWKVVNQTPRTILISKAN